MGRRALSEGVIFAPEVQGGSFATALQGSFAAGADELGITLGDLSITPACELFSQLL
jgi:hypothetical protein